jgi:glycosyltransferase involved in cell wall biosynthesis
VRRSDDPRCARIGVVGGTLPNAVPITAEMTLSERAVELACVVHVGLSDDAAFGNVLLAQAGIPAVVADTEALRALFASDVAAICSRDAIEDAVARFVRDPAERRHYGELLAADARRRFSPRRSAIRVVDLLCASRFGPEVERAARGKSRLR